MNSNRLLPFTPAVLSQLLSDTSKFREHAQSTDSEEGLVNGIHHNSRWLPAQVMLSSVPKVQQLPTERRQVL